MTQRDGQILGMVVLGAVMGFALVTTVHKLACQQLIKQAQHANQPAIAEWIKGSEACN